MKRQNIREKDPERLAELILKMSTHNTGLTIKPADSSFGRGRVIEGHGTFSLWLTGGFIRVDVDHKKASLFVQLKSQNEDRSLSGYSAQHDERIYLFRFLPYLDDSYLLEVVTNFLNCGVF